MFCQSALQIQSSQRSDRGQVSKRSLRAAHTYDWKLPCLCKWFHCQAIYSATVEPCNAVRNFSVGKRFPMLIDQSAGHAGYGLARDVSSMHEPSTGTERCAWLVRSVVASHGQWYDFRDCVVHGAHSTVQHHCVASWCIRGAHTRFVRGRATGNTPSRSVYCAGYNLPEYERTDCYTKTLLFRCSTETYHWIDSRDWPAQSFRTLCIAIVDFRPRDRISATPSKSRMYRAWRVCETCSCVHPRWQYWQDQVDEG